MKLIDLHVHSTISDGSYTPAEVVALAKKKEEETGEPVTIIASG